MYRCIFLGIKPTCYLTPCVCHNRATVLTGSTSPEAIIASILAGKSSGSDISRTASYSVVLLFDPRIVGTDKNTQIYKYNTVLFPVRTLSSITAACADTQLFIHFRVSWLFQKKKNTRNRHCLRSITAAQTLSYLFTSGCRGYSRKQNHAKHTPRTNLSLKLYPHRSSSVSGSGKVPLECIVTLQNRSQIHSQASTQKRQNFKAAAWRPTFGVFIPLRSVYTQRFPSPCPCPLLTPVKVQYCVQWRRCE